MRRTVIALHGVGSAVRGDIGKALAAVLRLGTVRHSTVTVGGHTLLELQAEATNDRILELNWSDLMRPKSTLAGGLRHVWYLINCMVDVAALPVGSRSPIFARLFRWVVFTLSPGVALMTIASSVSTVIRTAWLRDVILVALVIVAAAFAWRSRRLGRHYRWLWLWAALTALASAVAVVGANDAVRFLLVSLGRAIRPLGFVAGAAFLALAVGESFFLRRAQAWTVRTAHAALLYVPYLAMNAALSWLVFLGLGLIKQVAILKDYQQLESVLTPCFDLQLLEKLSTIVLGSLGLLALALPIAGYLLRPVPSTTGKPINEQGRGAQEGLAWLLTLMLWVLVALGTASSAIVARGGCPEETNILAIYTISVLRTLPLLAWLAGPFAVALDVAGDVLFYLQPEDHHPAAIRKPCQLALAAAIEYAQSRPDEEVVVLAHSQGSVIAADVLALDPSKISLVTVGSPLNPRKISLVTVGSPLKSLYVRFLDIAIAGPRDHVTWLNGYRDGDYIAGPLDTRGVTDKWMGPGQHVDYWSAPEVRELIREATGWWPPRHES